MKLHFVNIVWENNRSYWTNNSSIPKDASFAIDPKTEEFKRNDIGERLCCLPNLVKVSFATPLNEIIYVDITNTVKNAFKTRKNITPKVRNAIEQEFKNNDGKVFMRNPITHEIAPIMSVDEARSRGYKICGISSIVKKALETIGA